MNNNNVCKFPSFQTEKSLKANSFVWEKNPEIIKNTKRLASNTLILVTNGRGEMTFDGNTFYTIKTGYLLFGFEGERLACKNFSNLEYAYVNFEGLRSQELFDRFGITDENRMFSNYDFLIPIWKESLFSSDQSNVDLACESIILHAFSTLSHAKQLGHPLVEKMKKLAKENFSSAQFGLSSISNQLKYNSKYLSHLFKSYTKTGFTEYLRSLRIKNAVSLFDYGLDSVKNVAILSGFSDPLYFSSVFKSEVGLSPKQYIEKIQNAPRKEV
ncbi:MAG: helix-turn-helix transcriptional regulator [Clostridia bacterium]|nr:helix-turn-helix transcriptional regulator [Clostridia bacterium]